MILSCDVNQRCTRLDVRQKHWHIVVICICWPHKQLLVSSHIWFTSICTRRPSQRSNVKLGHTELAHISIYIPHKPVLRNYVNIQIHIIKYIHFDIARHRLIGCVVNQPVTWFWSPPFRITWLTALDYFCKQVHEMCYWMCYLICYLLLSRTICLKSSRVAGD